MATCQPLIPRAKLQKIRSQLSCPSTHKVLAQVLIFSTRTPASPPAHVFSCYLLRKQIWSRYTPASKIPFWSTACKPEVRCSGWAHIPFDSFSSPSRPPPAATESSEVSTPLPSTIWGVGRRCTWLSIFLGCASVLLD